MDSKRKLVIGTTLAFLAGCAIGLAFGGFQGFRFGTSLIINQALARDARDVEARIAILRNLRAGEQAPATEALETGLSDILIGFDPAEPYAGLDGETMAALRNAIAAARAYRTQHPPPAEDLPGHHGREPVRARTLQIVARCPRLQQRRERFRRHRPAEVVTLALVAAIAAQ